MTSAVPLPSRMAIVLADPTDAPLLTSTTITAPLGDVIAIAASSDPVPPVTEPETPIPNPPAPSLTANMPESLPVTDPAVMAARALLDALFAKIPCPPSPTTGPLATMVILAPPAPFIALIPCPPRPVTDPVVRIDNSPPLLFTADMPVPLEANTVPTEIMRFPVPLFDASIPAPATTLDTLMMTSDPDGRF